MRRTILSILWISILLLAGAGRSDAARLALVIGNDDYTEVVSLQKAVNDSIAMANALERSGFTVIRAKNLTRREMNRQLQSFTTRLQPGDEALFYYAGHGVEIAGRNYLLPTDIPNAKPGRENFIKREALPVDEILDSIRSRGALISILVLDACRNNPFPSESTRSLGGSRGLARMPAPEGTFILYSAGVGQTALDRLSDDDPDPNSVFTRSLIPLIAKPGFSLIETARQVRREVQKLAKTVSHDQRPAYYDEVIGDFFFNKMANAAVEPHVSISDQEARTFVSYLHSREPIDRMADFVGRHYSSFVDYYGRGRIPKEDVLADKLQWFNRWSDWSTRVDESSLSLLSRNDGSYSLEYFFDYRWVGKQGSADEGKTLSGRAVASRTIRKSDGQITIEMETSKRIQ